MDSSSGSARRYRTDIMPQDIVRNRRLVYRRVSVGLKVLQCIVRDALGGSLSCRIRSLHVQWRIRLVRSLLSLTMVSFDMKMLSSTAVEVWLGCVAQYCERPLGTVY